VLKLCLSTKGWKSISKIIDKIRKALLSQGFSFPPSPQGEGVRG